MSGRSNKIWFLLLILWEWVFIFPQVSIIRNNNIYLFICQGELFMNTAVNDFTVHVIDVSPGEVYMLTFSNFFKKCNFIKNKLNYTVYMYFIFFRM